MIQRPTPIPLRPMDCSKQDLGIQPATGEAPKSTYDYISTLKRQKPSGKKFEYTSVNTFVVAWLAEKVTGKCPTPNWLAR